MRWKRRVETDGESLVQGLENLVRDIESNQGDLLVTLADREAFKVGENIATTPGAVVYRNRMLELIQYTPTTETVHKTPLLIFPPWINKFYVMDLKPAEFADQVDRRPGLHAVRRVLGQPRRQLRRDRRWMTTSATASCAPWPRCAASPARQQINAVGYCIAGTTLGLTLAHLQKAGRRHRQIRHLLHHPDRFFRPRRSGRVPERRFRRRHRTPDRTGRHSVANLHERRPSASCARTT